MSNPSERSLAVLVLSRKIGESIYIGPDIVVTVLETKGRVVRIGIAAPRSIIVQREELLEKKTDCGGKTIAGKS